MKKTVDKSTLAPLIPLIDGPLGPEWKDHPLTGGDWIGHRECHIGGDFLLAYKLVEDSKPSLVIFVRAGTHGELF